MREQAAVLAPQLEHAAVFYRGTDEYLGAVLGFVAGGLERADPVFVAVPPPKVSLLREHPGGQAGPGGFAHLNEKGAQPAWGNPPGAGLARTPPRRAPPPLRGA